MVEHDGTRWYPITVCWVGQLPTLEWLDRYSAAIVENVGGPTGVLLYRQKAGHRVL